MRVGSSNWPSCGRCRAVVTFGHSSWAVRHHPSVTPPCWPPTAARPPRMSSSQVRPFLSQRPHPEEVALGRIQGCSRCRRLSIASRWWSCRTASDARSLGGAATYRQPASGASRSPSGRDRDQPRVPSDPAARGDGRAVQDLLGGTCAQARQWVKLGLGFLHR
jgi:hypothetical protein